MTSILFLLIKHGLKQDLLLGEGKSCFRCLEEIYRIIEGTPLEVGILISIICENSFFLDPV